MISEANTDPEEGATPPPGTSSRLRVGLDLGLVAAGIALLATSTPTIFGDGWFRYEALNELLSKGPNPTVQSSPYSFAGPIFSTPLYVIGRAFGNAEAWTARYNLVLFVLFLAALWVVLRPRVPRRVVATFLLLLVGASMFPANVLAYY